MNNNDIKWLNQKLKYETIGEDFEMDIDHWIDKFEDVSDKWFNRMRALFFTGQIDELEKDLDMVGIKRINN